MIFVYLRNGQNNSYYNLIHKKVVFFRFTKQKIFLICFFVLICSVCLFNDSALEYISQYRHLGALLSSNLSQSSHINTIVTNTIKLCPLKNLNLYNIFYKTTTSASCRSWSGCTQFDIDKLEKIKLYAAKILTGLSVIASTNSLYLETNGNH